MNFALRRFLILPIQNYVFPRPLLPIFPEVLASWSLHSLLIIFLSSISDASFTRALSIESFILPTLLLRHPALA